MERNEWLEGKIKHLSPDARVLAREIWECDNFEDLEKLVRKWKKETEECRTVKPKADQ